MTATELPQAPEADAVGAPVERPVRPSAVARRLAEAIDPLRRKAAPDHLTVGAAAKLLEAQAAEIERLRDLIQRVAKYPASVDCAGTLLRADVLREAGPPETWKA